MHGYRWGSGCRISSAWRAITTIAWATWPRGLSLPSWYGRFSCVPRRKWLFFIVVCVCLALSAFYEFIEWWAALVGGIAATDFLGTQGDVWDTQWDMFLAFIGSIFAQVFLAKEHDREISELRA